MGLPTQMDENERGIFAVNGISGMLIATVLLLSILGGLTYFSVVTQKNNAEIYYDINQDLDGLKFNSSSNHKLRTVK
jgi:hypothetical protein